MAYSVLFGNRHVNYNYTPLGQAVSQDGRVDELRSLIAAGCDLNAPADSYNRTPLQIALNHATSSLMEYVSILIGAGALVDRAGAISPPLVDIVARAGDRAQDRKLCQKVAERLIKAGCDVNQCSSMYNIDQHEFSFTRTALAIAAELELPEFAEMLIDAGADPNIKCDDFAVKCTPLHLAAWNGHLEVGKVLIRANSDLHALSVPIEGSKIPLRLREGTPLVCALNKSTLAFAELLLSADFRPERELCVRPLKCKRTEHCLKVLETDPGTAQCLSRCFIRDRLRGANFKQKIIKLKLPHTVVYDLLFMNIK